MTPYVGPSLTTSFEESLEHEFFSKFVALHLIGAVSAFTAIWTVPDANDHTFLLLVSTLCALPPVLALLVPRWVQRHVIALWALTCGLMQVLAIGAGHDLSVLAAATMYSALGPLPPRWRFVPTAMAGTCWILTKIVVLNSSPISLYLFFWTSFFSLWLSTSGYHARRASWLEVRLSLQQDRLLTQDIDAASPPSGTALDESELLQSAVHDLETALATAGTEQHEKINRALGALRRTLEEPAAEQTARFITRFRLSEVIDIAWRAAMTQSHSPIRVHATISERLEAYGDIPRVSALFRELLMELSLCGSNEPSRSLTIEPKIVKQSLYITFIASDQRPLPQSSQHHLERLAAESGARLEFRPGRVQVHMPKAVVS